MRGGFPGARSAGNTALRWPLKTSTNGRHLIEPNGRPFFVLGDAAWSAAVQLSLTTLRQYLDDRRTKGFNSIIVELIERKFNSNSDATHGNSLSGGLPFTANLGGGSPDFTLPSSTYWAWVDTIFNEAASRGLNVFATPLYQGSNGGDQGWYLQMLDNGSTGVGAYGTFLGNRYKKQPNLVWVIGGDLSPSSTPTALSGTGLTLLQLLATNIRAADPNHLVTTHWDELFASSTFGTSNLWDINLAKGDAANCADQCLTLYGSPSIPIFMGEAVYEGNGSYTDAQLRSEFFSSILSGGFGYISGSEYVWSFNSGNWSLDTRVNWQGNLNNDPTVDVARGGAFFQRFAWHLLVPDSGNTLVTSGKGTRATEDYCPAALSSDGAFALGYVPAAHAGTIAVTMPHSGTLRWWDPTNDTFTAIGSGLTGAQTLTRPGNNSAGANDWVWVANFP